MRATVAQRSKRRRLGLLICSRLSKVEAGLEHARQHDPSDSGLQVISGDPFQDSYEMSCSSSTGYTRFLTAESLVLDA